MIGSIRFDNKTNGEEALLEFEKSKARLNKVTGSIVNRGVKRYIIEGEWHKVLRLWI